MTEPADDGRRRWMASAIVVAVLTLAGLASTLLPRLAASPSAAARTKPVHVALPRPHTIVRDGVTYTVGAARPLGAVRDRSDPKAVTVFADSQYHSSAPQCNAITPSVRVVRENDTSVTVATFDYAQRPRPRAVLCAYTYDTRTPPKEYMPITVHLSRPLGHRTLIDAGTGAEIGLLPLTERPDPGYLPAGYVRSSDKNFAHSDDLIALGEYSDGDQKSVEIRFRSRSAWSLNGKVVGHATVHGVPATITDEFYERCVSWSDPPGIVREVCSVTKEAFLPASQLLRIANSLRH